MRMDPEDKDYVCTLTEYSLEKAKKELNEDPKERLGAVSALRAWIRAQPHFIACRTDTRFLLEILRTAKFSQLRARTIIESMLMFRTKCPQYLVNLDSHEPGILRFIERGCSIALPKRNAEGQLLYIVRVSGIDLHDALMNAENELRAGFALQELLKEEDENISVNGVHLVFDMAGMSMKHVTRDGAAEARNNTKTYQESTTGRIKGFHLYNGGAFVEVIVALMKTFLKKKFVERTYVHNTMESLYKIFPMEMWPDEYLPDDYKGPSAGPIQKILDDTKSRMMDPGFRAKLLDYTQERYKIDLSKKTNNVEQASFRKLNTD